MMITVQRTNRYVDYYWPNSTRICYVYLKKGGGIYFSALCNIIFRRVV